MMMKKIIVILVVLPIFGFSQEGKPIKSIAIPRMDLPKPDDKPETATNAPQYSIAKPFEPKIFKVPPKVYDAPKETSKMEMQPQKSDLNVGKLYADKINNQSKVINEGSGDSKAFRKNQFFGDFQTESETIGLTYRDFGQIDADRIRVWVDGKVVAELLELEADTKKIHIGLLLGINHIEIEAVNEGQLAPNTGDFSFYDDKGRLIMHDLWGLATGFKAVFNIIRVEKGSLK